MMRQWEPEHTVEPSLALELVQKQFPKLAAKTVRLLGAGWDNTAFLINDDLIFRFPRREIALALLEAEVLILPKLAPRLSLPIPVPRWKGTPTSQFPWPFAGYRMLAGSTACYANLSENARAMLAFPIARFLRELHKTPLSIASGCHFVDNRERMEWQKLIPKILANSEELVSLRLFENRDLLVALVQRLHNLRAPVTTTIVHGDFYIRHLLVDEKQHLTGVIDWGDIHIGDPAIDLAIAHSFLPPSAHALFRETYGAISPETWALARLRAIHSALLQALYGHHSNDPVILREGLRSIHFILTQVAS
jgi:aminoglycoside phosphotransferase (APT) family kinase protein